MPRLIEFAPTDNYDNSKAGKYPVATEDELLEFVNKGRAAGGAEILDGLLPSKPQDNNSCLIANGLNFGCYVGVDGPQIEYYPYRWTWYMVLPSNIDSKVVLSLAAALDLKVSCSGDFTTVPSLARCLRTSAMLLMPLMRDLRSRSSSGKLLVWSFP